MKNDADMAPIWKIINNNKNKIKKPNGLVKYNTNYIKRGYNTLMLISNQKNQVMGTTDLLDN